MIGIEAPAPAQVRVVRDGRRGRRRAAAAVLVLLVVGAGSWWYLTAPRLTGGGYAHVSSSDHEVVTISGFDDSAFVVPASVPGESTVGFQLRNDGPLDLELVDVWPSTRDGLCFWQPGARRFQDDPRTMYSPDDSARPAIGAVLPAGGSATVFVTGAHPDPVRCEHAAVTLVREVEVVTRSAGRTSTVRVPLGFAFGYTDDPESLSKTYGVRVQPPVGTAVR